MLARNFPVKSDMQCKQVYQSLLDCFDISVSHTCPADLNELGRPLVFANLNQFGHIGSLGVHFVLFNVFNERVPFIINLEWALVPFLGWNSALFTSGRYVLLRQIPWTGKAVIDRVSQDLISGRTNSVYISVEGQRSRGKFLSPFKKGAAVLAKKSNALIVPIVMSNSCFDAMPFGSWKIRTSSRLHYRFLEPVDSEKFHDATILTAHLRKLAEEHVGTF